MKIYYPRNHYNSTYRGQVFPLLKPFIKDEGFTDVQRQAVYGVSEVDFEIVEVIDAAQVIILTMSWNYYSKTDQMLLAYTFIKEAKLTAKPVWSINNGDFGVKLPSIKDLVVFRQSGYSSNNQLGHIGFPSIINDYLSQNDLESIVVNNRYCMKPIVGFCGQARLSKLNAIKEMTRQGLRNLRTQVGLTNLEPQTILATSYFRAFLLKQLEGNTAIDCRFIKRKKYRAGVTKNKETHETTIQFYDNILESQYVLCVRGAGNFSVRFYETLMMGRIPLYVHTDGYLPLPDDIDWKSHVVWVDYKDRHRIGEILMDFHAQLDQENLIALFMKNRKLWKEKLTLSGFFKLQKVSQ